MTNYIDDFSRRLAQGAAMDPAAQARDLQTSSWVIGVMRIMLRGGTYQEAFDLVEDVFGNALTMSDARMDIIAHTRRFRPTNELVRQAIEDGVFNQDALSAFRKKGRTSRWSSLQGINIMETSEASALVECIFRVRGLYAAHIVMDCATRPLDDDLMGEFALLCECFDMRMQSSLSVSQLLGQSVSQAFVALAQGLPVPQKNVESWAQTAEFGQGRPFLLAQIDFGYSVAEEQLAIVSLLRAGERFPHVSLGLCENKLLMLFPREGTGAVSLDYLEEYLRENAARAGVSDAIDDIAHIRYAYLQSQVALDSPTSSSCKATRFVTCFAAYVLRSKNRDDALVSFCLERSVPARLLKDDESGDDDSRLLYEYLVGERRSSAVAQKLHMHRNTLLYRIRRIQETFGIDLDDWSTRERLIVEYGAMGYK